MDRKNITIAIGGGYSVDRAGLSALVSTFPNIQIVSSEAESVPQVLIWDTSNVRFAEPPAIQSETAVLLLLEELDFDSLPKNFSGLFSKEESPSALAAAIRQVARGEQYISPSLALAYLESQQDQRQGMQDAGLEELSEREQEILDLLAQGQSNKSIAGRLYLSIRTVEGHLARIYTKLGVHSRTEAMLIAINNR